MSIEVFCDTPFGNEQGWLAFQLAHMLRHNTISQALNGQVTQARLDMALPNDPSWMLNHAQAHLDICNLLGINASPYIAECDLTDPNIYAAWMQIHRDEHLLFDQALNL